MDRCLAKLTKEEIETFVLPFLPRNKRGFSTKADMADIVQCIIFKLKTGVQWHSLFIDMECVRPPFSWQLVYYYYRKWCRAGVFEAAFKTFLEVQKDKLDTENLNLDGTQSLAKRSGDAIAYQHRKKGRTSNVLVMTDGRGIPIALGDIVSGNHNDLFDVVPQLSKMVSAVNACGITVENSALNADKGFDSKALRRFCRRKKMLPNVKENQRNRRKRKRGRKREFYEKLYQRRFVNERCFAWADSFRTLLIRFDTSVSSWLNWHYLAFALIILKV
jgi:transposase